MRRSNANRRRVLIDRVRLWLKRPATFRVVVILLNVVNLILRLLNLIK